jgi:hypothetical protein
VTERNSDDCSYVDEWVSGTVTVKRTYRGRGHQTVNKHWRPGRG